MRRRKRRPGAEVSGRTSVSGWPQRSGGGGGRRPVALRLGLWPVISDRQDLYERLPGWSNRVEYCSLAVRRAALAIRDLQRGERAGRESAPLIAIACAVALHRPREAQLLSEHRAEARHWLRARGGHIGLLDPRGFEEGAQAAREGPCQGDSQRGRGGCEESTTVGRSQTSVGAAGRAQVLHVLRVARRARGQSRQRPSAPIVALILAENAQFPAAHTEILSLAREFDWSRALFRFGERGLKQQTQGWWTHRHCKQCQHRCRTGYPWGSDGVNQPLRVVACPQLEAAVADATGLRRLARIGSSCRWPGRDGGAPPAPGRAAAASGVSHCCGGDVPCPRPRAHCARCRPPRRLCVGLPHSRRGVGLIEGLSCGSAARPPPLRWRRPHSMPNWSVGGASRRISQCVLRRP